MIKGDRAPMGELAGSVEEELGGMRRRMACMATQGKNGLQGLCHRNGLHGDTGQIRAQGLGPLYQGPKPGTNVQGPGSREHWTRARGLGPLDQGLGPRDQGPGPREGRVSYCNPGPRGRVC